MNDDLKPGVTPVVVEIDVSQQFRNELLFTTREHMLQWGRVEFRKLGFGIIIGRSYICSNRRQVFATMRCERSGTYVVPIRKQMNVFFYQDVWDFVNNRVTPIKDNATDEQRVAHK